MNFEQARQYAFTIPWKVSECFSGPDCWCRIIVPVEPILYKAYDREEEYEVIRDGSIDKETAEYIVRLHNEDYERVKQSCRDAMKDIEFVKLDLSEEQVENLKQEFDRLNIGPSPRIIEFKEID